MKKGFTVIELLVTIAIIGILSSVVLSSLSAAHRQRITEVFTIPTAYACGNGFWENPCSSNAQVLNDIAANQKRLVAATPIPQIETSLERKNISKRAEIFNKENKVSYIYLVSYGKVMAFYTVKGKVSSLNSYMVPQEQLVDKEGNKCSYSNSDCFPTQAPDIDGSYGENTNGIFFFTSDGAYVEWSGEYMMSDQPLRLSTQPELTREVK